MRYIIILFLVVLIVMITGCQSNFEKCMNKYYESSDFIDNCEEYVCSYHNYSVYHSQPIKDFYINCDTGVGALSYTINLNINEDCDNLVIARMNNHNCIKDW